MRVPIIAGNWKMNKTPAEALEFVNSLKDELSLLRQIERVVCPPYLAIPFVSKALKGTGIGVGAQDVHWKDSGAFTSSISPNMLVGLADYTIIGHSETRQYLGVTDILVNKKTKAALASGLKPIVAVGETLEQNERGETEAICSSQLRGALEGITAEETQNIIIAYEPVWAIGTGKNATPEQAQDIIGNVVRQTLVELYGRDVAQTIRIQYGGSMNPANCGDLMKQPDIDGGLIGGASLKKDDFLALMRISIEAKGLA